MTCCCFDSYAKLLSYKDEYEVARLFCEPAFKRSLGRSSSKVTTGSRLNLAPPMLTGESAERASQEARIRPNGCSEAFQTAGPTERVARYRAGHLWHTLPNAAQERAL